MDTSYPPLEPKVVLGVAAHPDDLDFGAAGTMAHFARQGASVHYLILTDGSKGTSDHSLSPEALTRLRHQEQQAALEAVGGSSVQFLDYPDGGLEVTMELKKDIVRVIRSLRPDTVVAMDPTMVYSVARNFINHPDHRAAGQAALDAVFPLARDHLSFPELYEEGYQPHKVRTVLLTNFDKNDFCVDITATMDQKLAALAAHKSQIADIEAIRQEITERAQKLGRPAGYPYAECFVRLAVQP